MSTTQILTAVSALEYTPAERGECGLPEEIDGITYMAQSLNCIMADSAEHRAAYLAIWGVEWEPLPYCAGLADATPHARSSTAARTMVR